MRYVGLAGRSRQLCIRRVYCPIKPEGRGTAEHVVMIKAPKFLCRGAETWPAVRDETEHERPVRYSILASAKAIGGYFTTNFFVPADLSLTEISTW